MAKFTSTFQEEKKTMSMSKSKESGKRQVMREKRRQRQRQQRLLIFGVIVVAAVLIVAAIAGPAIREALAPVGEIVQVTPQPRPQASANTMGDPNAPVKIIEYSDFQCPFCKQFADQTEAQLVENYIATGKVYFEYVSMGNWVSRNIAQSTGRPERFESRNAAEAALCAGDQNKFWEYHDILYANALGEDEGYFTDKRLAAYAETVGLDLNQFNDCYDSAKYRDQVAKGYTDGVAAGVSGTPAFFINGKMIEGAQPYDVFVQEIEAALGGTTP
jgi:protein-disulfide isomerase